MPSELGRTVVQLPTDVQYCFHKSQQQTRVSMPQVGICRKVMRTKEPRRRCAEHAFGREKLAQVKIQ